MQIFSSSVLDDFAPTNNLHLRLRPKTSRAHDEWGGALAEEPPMPKLEF